MSPKLLESDLEKIVRRARARVIMLLCDKEPSERIVGRIDDAICEAITVFHMKSKGKDGQRPR